MTDQDLLIIYLLCSQSILWAIGWRMGRDWALVDYELNKASSLRWQDGYDFGESVERSRWQCKLARPRNAKGHFIKRCAVEEIKESLNTHVLKK